MSIATHTGKGDINGIATEIAVCGYSDVIFVVISQLGTIGSLVLNDFHFNIVAESSITPSSRSARTEGGL